MLKVKGTVRISFEVLLDVDDISDDVMDMYDSDNLIAGKIEEKLDRGLFVEGDIFVKETQKIASMKIERNIQL